VSWLIYIVEVFNIREDKHKRREVHLIREDKHKRREVDLST
jgi:hypothetical protein